MVSEKTAKIIKLSNVTLVFRVFYLFGFEKSLFSYQKGGKLWGTSLPVPSFCVRKEANSRRSKVAKALPLSTEFAMDALTCEWHMR